MKVGIIGGGIIGLCSAWYLLNEGIEVEIYIEKGMAAMAVLSEIWEYLSSKSFVYLLRLQAFVWQRYKMDVWPHKPFLLNQGWSRFYALELPFWRNASENKVNIHSPCPKVIFAFRDSQNHRNGWKDWNSLTLP